MSSRILKPWLDSAGRASPRPRPRRSMKKPLIGSVSVDPQQEPRPAASPNRLMRDAQSRQPFVGAAFDVAARRRRDRPRPSRSVCSIAAAASRRAGGRRRSPRHSAPGAASMPSMQAPARPRRPMRRMQRTRGPVRRWRGPRAAVPSGELSSTKMTSQFTPASAAPQQVDQ